MFAGKWIGPQFPLKKIELASNKVDTIGGKYYSSEFGARLEIFPDPNTGLVIYDNAETKVFETLVDGTDVGDVIIGDFAGNTGLKYDKSAGTFTFIGGIIAIGSSNNIFKADSNGIYLGNATFASAPFKVSMTGALVATSATITGTIKTAASGTRLLIDGATNSMGYYNGAEASPRVFIGAGSSYGLVQLSDGTHYADLTSAGYLHIYGGTGDGIFIDRASGNNFFSATTSGYLFRGQDAAAAYADVFYVLHEGSTYFGGDITLATSKTVDTIEISSHDHTGAAGRGAQIAGGSISGTVTPSAHNLIDGTGHPVSGLTTGHFLKATGATTYAFGAHGLSYGDVGAAASGHNHSGTYVPTGLTTLSGYGITDAAPSSHVGAGGAAHADVSIDPAVAGFMTAAQASKLFGIEAGADVTDATNVTAAGAVMTESDPTIYAWAKAATKPAYTYTEVGAAASGHVGAGGAAHADVSIDPAVAGFMTAAQASKLFGIEAGADVTDATNVTAAGAVMDGDFSSNGFMTRTAAGSYSINALGLTDSCIVKVGGADYSLHFTNGIIDTLTLV